MCTLLWWHLKTDAAYVVILAFYFILACLAPSRGQKMFSKVILIATARSANVVFKISQIILIHDSSFQCYFRSNRKTKFWNGSSFISFCWFCHKSNFRKTSEAIEYENFTNLHKKNLGHFNTCQFEWTNSVPIWQHSFMNESVSLGYHKTVKG